MIQTVEQIRSQFRALDRRHRDQPVAYFDGPGGTQVPEPVIEAMADYLRYHNANTHWNYPSSHETDQMIGEARQAVGEFLNAGPDEIAFGLNMTTLTFHLARGLVRGWRAGDEVIVTELDHQGNVGPWEAIAKDADLRIVRIPFRPGNGTLDLDRLVGSIGPKTRLVAIGWASNALGTVTDVAVACRAARAQGVTSFVDAVHSAPHVLPDVQAIGCDYLGCSPYKFYGPHMGVLFGRRSLIEKLDIPRVAPAPNTCPDRLETGTQSHEAIVGTRAAIDFLAAVSPATGRRASLEASYQVLHERASGLFQRMWDGIGAIPGVERFGLGPQGDRTPTLGFVVRGRRSSEVATLLAAQAVIVSHGGFYATSVIERLGLGDEGLVRAGCACYTTEGEVDRLIAGVRGLSAG